MAEQKAAPEADKPSAPNRKKQTLMLAGLLLAVMLVEGGGIYFAVKFMGGGPSSAAAEGLVSAGGHGGGQTEAAAPAVRDVEIPVVKFKAPNMKTGRLFLYDIEVYAKAKKERAEELKKMLEATRATVEDRLSRVIRAAEPQDLQEDGLETIRRQVKHELGQIVGDEKMVEEVLIPTCTPFKVDY